MGPRTTGWHRTGGRTRCRRTGRWARFLRWLALARRECQHNARRSPGLPSEGPEPLRPTARRPGSHLAALSSGPIQPRYRALLRLAMRPPGHRSLRPEVFRTLLAAGRQYDAATDPAHPSATRSMSRATICAGNRPASEEARVGPRRTL